MRNYFSTLAAILSAVVLVITARSCNEYFERQAEIEKLSRAIASPTPWMPTVTPAPSYVRVTMDLDVYGRNKKAAHLKAGTRVKVLDGSGAILQIEYEGEQYALDAALTTRSD